MGFLNGKYDGARELSLVHQGQPCAPDCIVLHYTATDTVAEARAALDARGESTHFLIGPDGDVHQTRRPDIHAAHTGRSNWKPDFGLDNAASLDRHAVGIGLVNRGFFADRGGGQAFDLDAHGDVRGQRYPLAAVGAASALYDPARRRAWHRFAEAQLAAAARLIAALRDAYGLAELVGHDDIAIGARHDPGPLFPTAAFRQELRLAGALGPPVRIHAPDGATTLRRCPASGGGEVTDLRNGEVVFLRSVTYTQRPAAALRVDREGERYLAGWASVDVGGLNTHAGFLPLRHLSPVPLAAGLALRL